MDIQTYLQKINESPLSQAHKDQIVALVNEHGFNDEIAHQIQDIIKADMEDSDGIPLTPAQEATADALNAEIAFAVDTMSTEINQKAKEASRMQEQARIDALRADLLGTTN